MKKLFALVAVAVSLVACGPAQTDGCKKYLTCQTAVSASAGAALESSYGASGSCWQSTQAVADACDVACKAGTSSLASQNPDVAACK